MAIFKLNAFRNRKKKIQLFNHGFNRTRCTKPILFYNACVSVKFRHRRRPVIEALKSNVNHLQKNIDFSTKTLFSDPNETKHPSSKIHRRRRSDEGDFFFTFIYINYITVTALRGSMDGTIAVNSGTRRPRRSARRIALWPPRPRFQLHLRLIRNRTHSHSHRYIITIIN